MLPDDAPSDVMRLARLAFAVSGIANAVSPGDGRRRLVLVVPPVVSVDADVGAQPPATFRSIEEYAMLFEGDDRVVPVAYDLAALYNTQEPVVILTVDGQGQPNADGVACLQRAGLVVVQVSLVGGLIGVDRKAGWTFDGSYIQRVLCTWPVAAPEDMLQGDPRQALFFRQEASRRGLSPDDAFVLAWVDDAIVDAAGVAVGACWAPVTGPSAFTTSLALAAMPRGTARTALPLARAWAETSMLVAQTYNVLTSGGRLDPLPAVIAARVQLVAAAATTVVLDPVSGAVVAAAGIVPIQGAQRNALACVTDSIDRCGDRLREACTQTLVLPRCVRIALHAGDGWQRVAAQTGTPFVPGRAVAAGSWDRAGTRFTATALLTGLEWRGLAGWTQAWALLVKQSAKRTGAPPTAAVLVPESVIQLPVASS